MAKAKKTLIKLARAIVFLILINTPLNIRQPVRFPILLLNGPFDFFAFQPPVHSVLMLVLGIRFFRTIKSKFNLLFVSKCICEICFCFGVKPLIFSTILLLLQLND